MAHFSNYNLICIPGHRVIICLLVVSVALSAISYQTHQ